MKISTFAEDAADVVLPVSQGDGKPVGEVALFFRPFMYEFLEEMRTKFELVVYSSLGGDYLKTIVDFLERTQKYFEYRFDDKFCIFANFSSCVKCIDFLLSNRSPENIVVVDTSAKSLPLTPTNLVTLPRYEGSPLDCDLVKLAAVLDTVAREPDCRIGIAQLQRPTQ